MSTRRASLLRRRPALIAACSIGIIAIVFVAILATRTSEPPSLTDSPLLGQEAPAITGMSLTGDGAVSLASLRGSYVVVNFFASWCQPCETETPQLVAFLYAERKLGVRAIGVVYDDSADNAKTFLAKLGATWPAVTDPNGELAAAYGVDDPPDSFLVAPNGRIVANVAGALTESILLKALSVSKVEGT